MVTDGHETLVADKREIARLMAAASCEGEVDSYAGKRRSSRVADGLQIEVTNDVNDPSAIWPATMKDVSEGGISFWSKRYSSLHATIFLREFSSDNSGVWLPARVRHCTRGIRGYRIGAEFYT